MSRRALLHAGGSADHNSALPLPAPPPSRAPAPLRALVHAAVVAGPGAPLANLLGLRRAAARGRRHACPHAAGLLAHALALRGGAPRVAPVADDLLAIVSGARCAGERRSGSRRCRERATDKRERPRQRAAAAAAAPIASTAPAAAAAALGLQQARELNPVVVARGPRGPPAPRGAHHRAVQPPRAAALAPGRAAALAAVQRPRAEAGAV